VTVPTVSVIIPCFNYERWVAGAVRSALDQDWPAIEVIAVDDGSTDRTPEILASFGDAIRVIRRPNGGLNAATSTGLEAATGEFLTFLDADDEWGPDRCRLLAEALIAAPNAGLVYGDMEIIDTQGRTRVASFREDQGIDAVGGRVLGRLLAGNFISAGSLMVRSSLRSRFHPIPDFAAWQDWWIATRVAEVADVLPIDAVVNRYRDHGGNMNLGVSGPAFVELCRTELPFRRWLLTALDPAHATAKELVTGLVVYDSQLNRVANADNRPVREIGAPNEEERARAGAAFAEGLSALAAHGVERAVPALVVAAALVPGWVEPRLVLDDLLPEITGEPEREAAPATRGLAIAVSAAAVFREPALLEAWARTFSGRDDITLVVTGVREPRYVDALVALAASYGLDRLDAADVVAVEERHLAAVSARLGRPLSAAVGDAADVAALAEALAAVPAAAA